MENRMIFFLAQVMVYFWFLISGKRYSTLKQVSVFKIAGCCVPHVLIDIGIHESFLVAGSANMVSMHIHRLLLNKQSARLVSRDRHIKDSYTCTIYNICSLQDIHNSKFHIIFQMGFSTYLNSLSQQLGYFCLGPPKKHNPLKPPPAN